MITLNLLFMLIPIGSHQLRHHHSTDHPGRWLRLQLRRRHRLPR